MGINGNFTEHALFGRFMFGKVADTIGVLNSIKGIQQQMLFADFDNSDLQKVFKDIEQLKRSFYVGDMLLFKSEMDGQGTHYFIISPCKYEPKQIRLMLATLDYCDPKFVAVYMRDGVNAIRLIPKIMANGKPSRIIKFVNWIQGSKQMQFVKGMDKILYNNFPDYNTLPDGLTFDDTDTNVIITREYETIRW